MTTTRVAVLVGTDHHQFSRLIAWADALAERPPAELGDVQLRVQYGFSGPNRLGEGASILAPEEVGAWLEWADVAVVHGGPGTINAARAARHLPVVVPRNPLMDEHVDDHQQRFGDWMDARGRISLARTEDEFRELVVAAAADPKPLTDDAALLSTDQSAIRAGQLIDADPAANRPVTVLYLAGIPRSGSTLLERLMAAQGDVCGVGETVHLWQRGAIDNELCGCGDPFLECEFWTLVGKTAFGGWDRGVADHALALKHDVDRTRKVPSTLAGRVLPLHSRKVRRYGEFYRALYRSVLDVSAASIVLDSSKHVSLAASLAVTPGVDLRVVHVIRDPRAVAHSWSRAVPRPEAGGADTMPTAGASRIAARWSLQNGLLTAMSGRVPTLRLTYEALVDDPNAAVAAIREFAGLPAGEPPVAADGTLASAQVHSAAGNPMRFTYGAVKIGADDSWRRGLARADRLKVGALTAPLATFYYAGRRNGSSGGERPDPARQPRPSGIRTQTG